MVSVDITVSDDDYQRVVGHLASRLDESQMMNFIRGRVVRHLRSRIASRFTSEGDDASGKWQPLKSSTERIRRAKGFPASHPINVRTGEMERFLNGNSGLASTTAGGVELIFPGPAAADVAEKIQTAQLGRGRPSTVARPVLALNLNDQNQIVTDLARFILAGL